MDRTPDARWRRIRQGRVGVPRTTRRMRHGPTRCVSRVHRAARALRRGDGARAHRRPHPRPARRRHPGQGHAPGLRPGGGALVGSAARPSRRSAPPAVGVARGAAHRGAAARRVRAPARDPERGRGQQAHPLAGHGPVHPARGAAGVGAGQRRGDARGVPHRRRPRRLSRVRSLLSLPARAALADAGPRAPAAGRDSQEPGRRPLFSVPGLHLAGARVLRLGLREIPRARAGAVRHASHDAGVAGRRGRTDRAVRPAGARAAPRDRRRRDGVHHRAGRCHRPLQQVQ